MEKTEKGVDFSSGRKEKIAEILFEFVNAGFDVSLGKSWIEIKESFKSQSRDKYKHETVFSSVGSWDYWREEGNTLDLQLSKLREWRRELLENEEYPLSAPKKETNP